MRIGQQSRAVIKNPTEVKLSLTHPKSYVYEMVVFAEKIIYYSV